MDTQKYTCSQESLEKTTLIATIVECMQYINSQKLQKHATNQVKSVILNYYLLTSNRSFTTSDKTYQELTSKVQEIKQNYIQKLYSNNFFQQFGNYNKQTIEILQNISQATHYLLNQVKEIISDKNIQQYFVYNVDQDNLQKINEQVEYTYQYQVNKPMAKKNQYAQKIKSEYAFILWHTDSLLQTGADFTAQAFFWNGLVEIVYKLEGIQLTDKQKNKIMKLADPTNNQIIGLKDTSDFFNNYWGNIENKGILISSEEEAESQFKSGEVMILKCIQINKDDTDNQQLQNKEFLITRQGFDNNNSGITQIGRQSQIFHNDIQIYKNPMISRKQCQIIYKEKYGYCLVCTSSVNPTILSLQKDEERSLFNDCVIEIGNDYKLIVKEINYGTHHQKRQSRISLVNQQYNLEKLSSESTGGSELEESTIKTIQFRKKAQQNKKDELTIPKDNKMLIEEKKESDTDSDSSEEEKTIQVKRGQRKQQKEEENKKKQEEQKILQQLQEEATNQYIKNRPYIKLELQAHQQESQNLFNSLQSKIKQKIFEIKDQQPLVIGKQQLDIKGLQNEDIKIFWDQNDWKVKCKQNKDVMINMWVKTNTECNEFDGVPSQAVQLQNHDVFGVYLDEKKYIFEVEISDTLQSQQEQEQTIARVKRKKK